MYLKSGIYDQDIKNIIDLDLPWDKLQNHSLLLTGASGLIGTMLVDVLMAKNEKEQLNCKIYAVGRNEKKQRNVLLITGKIHVFVLWLWM